jgi:hypothetical protein
MYPRIPWKLVVDHLGSAEHTWGTAALYVHCQTRYTFYIYFTLLLLYNRKNVLDTKIRL